MFPDEFCVAGWCGEFPRPGPFQLRGVTLGGGTGYLGYEEGMLAKWDGAQWRVIRQGGTVSGMSFFQLGTTLYTGDGSSGLIIYDGTTFTRHQDPQSSFFISSIWATSPSDVWMNGGGDVLLHWTGSSFTNTGFPAATQPLSQIWGAATNDFWITGGYQPSHYLNGTFTPVAPPMSGSALYAVAGRSTSDVMLAGARACTFNGTTLTDVSLPSGNTVWALAASPTHYWAGGDNGFLASWNASAGWTVYPTDLGTTAIVSIAADGSDVWAAGTEGQLLRWNGSGFSRVDGNMGDTPPTTFVMTPDHVGGFAWRYGQADMPWRRNSDATWTQLPIGVPPSSLTGVCLSSPTAGAAVAGNYDSLWRFSGPSWGTWNNVPQDAGAIGDIACTPGGDVYFMPMYFGSLRYQRGLASPVNVGPSVTRVTPAASEAAYVVTYVPGNEKLSLIRDGGVAQVWSQNAGGSDFFFATPDHVLHDQVSSFVEHWYPDGGYGTSMLPFTPNNPIGFGIPRPETYVIAESLGDLIEVMPDAGYRYVPINSTRKALSCAPGVCRALFAGGVLRRDFP